MNKKKNITIRLSEHDRKKLMKVKGDSDIGSFVGFLVRNYEQSNLYSERFEVDHSADLAQTMQLTLDRLCHKVDNNYLTSPANCITESSGEVRVNDVDYQVQVRLQKDVSAWINPNSHELAQVGDLYDT